MKTELGPNMSRFHVPHLSDEQSLPGIETQDANLFAWIQVAYKQIFTELTYTGASTLTGAGVRNERVLSERATIL